MKEKKGKSWSSGIVLVYSVFALALLGFWYFSTHHKIELVTDNYYEQELNYETTIAKIRNTNTLADKPVFMINKQKNLLVLQMPAAVNPAVLRGKINLFRPSDAKMDRSFNLLCDSLNQQVIPINGLQPGKWRLKFDWTDGQKGYYQEQVIHF